MQNEDKKGFPSSLKTKIVLCEVKTKNIFDCNTKPRYFIYLAREYVL